MPLMENVILFAVKAFDRSVNIHVVIVLQNGHLSQMILFIFLLYEKEWLIN